MEYWREGDRGSIIGKLLMIGLEKIHACLRLPTLAQACLTGIKPQRREERREGQQRRETVETVDIFVTGDGTPLKRGVNENGESLST